VILVSGYMRVRDGDVDLLRGAISNLLYAAKGLDGCDEYRFSVDLYDPDLLWLSERWRDQPAQSAHLIGDHMVEFNIAMRRAKILKADIDSYHPNGSVQRLIEIGTDNKRSRRENMIIVMGYAKLAEGEFDRLAPEMATQVAATRGEEGCDLYCFSRDLFEPDTLVISERWRDRTALDAHFATPHMATFNEAIGAAKVLDISVKAYENGEVRTLIGQ
jgi:quinol monooxygenase YgiN